MAAGRIYPVTFSKVTVTAGQDLFEIAPAANKQVEFIGFTIDQCGNTDVGDSKEAFLRWEVIRGNATTGSGGTSPTPSPQEPSDTAAGFTAKVNNTTAASTGSPTTQHAGAFNVRGDYVFWWPPGTEPTCTAGQSRMVVRMADAPPASILLSATLYVRERG